MLWLRGILQPLTQRANRDTIAEAVRLAEADAREQQAQQPEQQTQAASAP
jgi:hypothetical protein